MPALLKCWNMQIKPFTAIMWLSVSERNALTEVTSDIYASGLNLLLIIRLTNKPINNLNKLIMHTIMSTLYVFQAVICSF